MLILEAFVLGNKKDKIFTVRGFYSSGHCDRWGGGVGAQWRFLSYDREDKYLICLPPTCELKLGTL